MNNRKELVFLGKQEDSGEFERNYDWVVEGIDESGADFRAFIIAETKIRAETILTEEGITPNGRNVYAFFKGTHVLK